MLLAGLERKPFGSLAETKYDVNGDEIEAQCVNVPTAMCRWTLQNTQCLILPVRKAWDMSATARILQKLR